jgi:diguanylate cyclase (GGDEF)-like protein/PAS domain S-box-containing protein
MIQLPSSEIFSTVLDGLPLSICVLDRDGKIIFWNQAAAHATGYMQHEVMGCCYQDVMLCRREDELHDEHSTIRPFTRIVHEGKAALLKTLLRHKRGYSLPVLIHITPVHNPHGSILAVAVSFDAHQPRTGAQHFGRNLPPLAAVDLSTGVANHSFTLFHLRESLTSFADYHIPFGILRVKPEALDHFRAAYGREASDAISRVIAQSLSNSFRPTDFLGRWADHEFLVILNNCPAAGVQSVYERTRSTIASAEIRWWGELLSVPLSFGCTSVELGDTVDLLLQRAKYPERPTVAITGSPKPRS